MHSLPLFHRIAGQPVIVLGEGDAAAAKRRLVERAGGVVVDADDREARLAFVAMDQPEAAAARLRARDVLVNVADRPDLCDFTVPSLLERGPVIVAVGTGGVSAGLAKALRLRLEAILPPSLGALAEALGGAREQLRQRWPGPAVRSTPVWPRAGRSTRSTRAARGGSMPGWRVPRATRAGWSRSFWPAPIPTISPCARPAGWGRPIWCFMNRQCPRRCWLARAPMPCGRSWQRAKVRRFSPGSPSSFGWAEQDFHLRQRDRLGAVILPGLGIDQRDAPTGAGHLAHCESPLRSAAAHEFNLDVDRFQAHRLTPAGQFGLQRRDRGHFHQPAQRAAVDEPGPARHPVSEIGMEHRHAVFVMVDSNAQGGGIGGQTWCAHR
jgi:siroheme synthase (precorrin-2 oxidase/ferrochelatase)